jgi:predicted DNA-binding protein with PD1-like motif
MKIFRLKPGQDLKKFLTEFASEGPFTGSYIASCVGSLSVANLRMAQADTHSTMKGPFEILSLNGTLCKDGVHLHLGIADHEGRAFGGHLLDGCLVLTTAEIVIAELTAVSLTREFDPATGYRELVVREIEGKQ